MSGCFELGEQREDLVRSWHVRGFKILRLWNWDWEKTGRMISKDGWEWEISLPPTRKWAKKVTFVDPKLPGGYALVGGFLDKKVEKLKIAAWLDLVVILRSDDVLEAYLATTSGVLKKTYNTWNGNKREVIRELKRVEELKTYVMGLTTFRGWSQEVGPPPEWLAFPEF
jgi:hypothetical protein